MSGCDRLVLLGDIVELRHGPMGEALGEAAPVLRELGSAVGEVVVVPGNHDHGLLRGWLERRGGVQEAPALGLESDVEWDPREGLGLLVEALAPARVRVSYPGVWLREDIYAIHGHYADRHNTVPIMERVGAGVTARIVGEPDGGPRRAEDYEASLGPMYAWIDAVAQSGGLRAGRNDGSLQVRAWRALSDTRGRGDLRRRGLAAAFPVMVAALNRVGIGPLRADISAIELRRAGLRAFAEVVERLQIPAAHVLFGHSHRAGPLPGDDRAEWVTAGGARLLNIGSWVYEPGYLGDSPRESPYRPGFAAIVGDDGAGGGGGPDLINLLDGDA